MNNRENIYDIDSYTDSELLDILDLNNPTDRELEAKIIFLIRKYENMQNESGNKLAKFFEDIYKHFFDLDSDAESDDQDENVIEGFDNTPILVRDLSMQTVAGYTYDPTTSINKGQTKAIKDPNVIRQNIEKQKQEMMKDPKQFTQRDPNLFKQGIASQPTTTQIGYTKSLDYTQDKLNPLLQQTIKRVISIDSQYRDNKRSLSTEFTFNLSDPLKDVVSLKLYSVQIPYTWYTINNNFGSNFFYLKGNSNGINNGNHDYIIDISAGNYSPTELATAVNNRITKLKTTVTDVSFGNTNINYDPYTSLSKLKVDIVKQYTETSYYLKFPYWTNSNDNTQNGPRYQSIPAFLGFDNIVNYPYKINSSKTLLLSTNTSSINEDNISRKYYIYTTSINKNNYFTVIRYYGPGEYNTNSIVDISFNITLSSKNDVTRSELVADLSNQIALNPYLSSESSIKRIDITDPLKNNVGNSYFELKIKANRYTTNNFTNSKIAILFPQENAQTNYSNIWTGLNSCFRFENLFNETNNIISEISPIKQESNTYKILSSPYIYLKCKASGFNISINDLSFTLSNSSINGYSLTEYISAINNSIKSTNDITKNIKNITGDLNEANTISNISTDSKFHIKFDINKKFNQDKYIIDVSNSFLSRYMGFERVYYDLSSTNVFETSFTQNSSYFLDGSYVAIIDACQNETYGNKNQAPYVVPIPTTKTYNSYQDLQTGINNSFNNFVDPSNGLNVLSGTNVKFTLNPVTQRIDCSLTIVLQKILTEQDYSVQFIDPSYDTTYPNTIDVSSTWYNYLHIDRNMIDNTYDLSNAVQSNMSYSDISGTTIVAQNKITITTSINDTIQLVPNEEGVNGSNILTITIPPSTYTRDNLITALNNAINTIPNALGSYFYIKTTNGIESTIIRTNINKIYTANDYRIVFYDPYSFIKCYVGVTSVRNTTWDTTLGWVLGFRLSTEYILNAYGSGQIIEINGDTGVSTNLFNYFMICLDDYNQNHLNDGLVTVTSKVTDVPLPAYANKTNFKCDPASGLLTYNTTSDVPADIKLTQNQLYSLTRIANERKSISTILSNNTTINTKSYGSGPFVKDVFGLIPMKVSGLANGSSYVEFGGTLQNQERLYFGPVNIHRMTVKLVSDRGDVVDLNGANWSFSLICEQLYKQQPNGGK